LGRDPDTVRGPDLILFDDVRRYEELNPKYCDRVPVLAVEVLSPTDRWGKVTRRLSQLLQRGVRLVWLVDPDDRSVTVYRPDQLPQVFDENEELTGDDVLPDLRCVSPTFSTARRRVAGALMLSRPALTPDSRWARCAAPKCACPPLARLATLTPRT